MGRCESISAAMTSRGGRLALCGLRGCVKQLTGARRWSARCQSLHDHIIDFLRRCLSADAQQQECALMVD